MSQSGEAPTAAAEGAGADHGAGSMLAAVFAMPIVRELGLRFPSVRPGEVEVEMPYEEHWSFRPGQFQATPVFAVADFAGVCAAGTLLPPGGSVSTVDCTLKLVAPALAGVLRARGRVVKEGRLLTVSSVEVFGGDGDTLCATALVTARNILPGR